MSTSTADTHNQILNHFYAVTDILNNDALATENGPIDTRLEIRGNGFYTFTFNGEALIEGFAETFLADIADYKENGVLPLEKYLGEVEDGVEWSGDGV